MVNRNSARHLLFVVSILLCFFIYMGYRFLGSSETQDAVTQYPPFEEAIASPSSGGMLAPPTDVSVPIDDGDTAWVSTMPSAPSSSSPVSALPMPPAASSAPPSTSHSGAITGLIPSPPSDTRPSGGDSSSGETAVASLPSLPIPAGSGSSAAAPTETGSSGVGLRPPVDDWEGMDDDEVTDLSDLSFMPSSPTASSSPARPVSSSGSAAAASAPLPPPPAAAVTPPPPPSTRPSYAPPAEDEPEWSRPAPGRTPPPPALATPPPPAPAVPFVTPPAPASPAREGGPSPYGPYQELPESLRIYVVLPGDTLTSIAARELGSASLAENIFLLNRDAIEDPDHLMAGVRIRLPVRETTEPVAEPAPDAPVRRPVMGLGRTHIVVRGDTLSSIAQQYYGTSSGWRFLFEANRTVVPNPNQLTVGMELSIPPYEE